MSPEESRAWDAHLSTLPPPAPAADRLRERVQAALLMLQELEVEMDRHPDLGEFAQQVTDAVSMIGRLTDHLDQADDEEPEEEQGHGWRMGG